MRRGFSAALRGIGLGLVLLVIAWIGPTLLDGGFLASAMLKADYSLPELVASYVPELRRAIQVSLVVMVGAALLGFLVWSLEITFFRPTGPTQVARSWRSRTWICIGLVVAGAVYACVEFATLGGLDSVDDVIANRAAFVLGVTALLLFWLLSLLGTERMLRPAIPAGALLVGRS